MKVSLNWLRYLNDKYQVSAEPAPDGVENLVERIGLQLGAVEEVIKLGERYKDIVVAKVVSAEKHPNADKLKVCLIDNGGADPVQVVCGAPNVKAGQLVAWIPPGVTVPSTYGKEPFVLESREIRGQMSNGMIASAKELALGDDHEGILVIDQAAKPGQAFTEIYRLDDHIIDIENKMFTHRPDLFGMLGIAREVAGVQGHNFKSPSWYREDEPLLADGRSNGVKLKVVNEVPELVPRFCAVAIKDVKVAPSPVYIQSMLARVGIRPINNIVDLTNYIMYETGQPLHAYDADKVGSAILGARLSKKGEKLRLLGGKEITLDAGAVVITDGKEPIGLGGVMGGADTEVDVKTKNIILECANFDMNRTRKSAMAYGLFTDAATRFTKNQSPRQNRAVIIKAIDDVLKVAGGRVASKLVDDSHFDKSDAVVKTDPDFINSRLGTKLTSKEILDLLSNVEFKVDANGGMIKVTAPFWRTDIEKPEDIVEEVGRLNGYDKLPAVLPPRDLAPAPRDQLLAFKSRLRAILARAGANEVLTYSFVHANLLKKSGQDPKDAYHIRNAVSPELQYYRLSVTPSLLEKVHPNIRAGFANFALFEMGKGHNQKMTDKTGLPVEFEMLSLVIASKDKPAKESGAPYFQARQLLDFLASELGISLEYRPIPKEEPYPAAKPFDHKRSAQVWAGKVPLGMVGEYKPTAATNLKLPSYCAGFEIGISQLHEATPAHKNYQPLKRYPELEQDFCLRSEASLSYKELVGFMEESLSRLTERSGYNFVIEPLDIYQKDGDLRHKQTTWRIILWHPERTLTTEETNNLLDELAARANKELKAERI